MEGDKTTDVSKTFTSFPYIINFCNLTQVRTNTGYVRSVRRVQQPPYPWAKIGPEDLGNMGGRRGAVAQNGSCKVGPQGPKGEVGASKKQGTSAGCGAVVSGKKTAKKTKNSSEGAGNIARTILSNLNIFGNKTTPAVASMTTMTTVTKTTTTVRRSCDTVLDADSSSTKSGRRPSIDTVSTYLSHESKDSELTASQSDLLDCSVSSDDVFESARQNNVSYHRKRQPASLPVRQDSIPSHGSIVGVDAASNGISQFVCVVEAGRARCPICLCELAPDGDIVVALSRCFHQLHLDCLNAMLTSQITNTNKVRAPTYGTKSVVIEVFILTSQVGITEHNILFSPLLLLNKALNTVTKQLAKLAKYIIQQPLSLATSPTPSIPSKAATHESSNLIVQLECQQCTAQYVGLTTENLCKRMNGHLHDIKIKHPEKPVSAHTSTHNLNFEDCYAVKSLYIQCPVCKMIYGEKTGNQPPGSMTWALLNHSLPGHPGSRTIQITYNIASGIQGPEHPSPGRPYYAVGFPRVCYLPDTEKGRRVLKLLSTAFERRLVFTVGRSVTTGREDVVTWNEIHHKTEAGSSNSGHGYPDPGYLDNCLSELAAHGVIDTDNGSFYQELVVQHHPTNTPCQRVPKFVQLSMRQI
uniref:E3 ubiquitin-protein ligase n=1 Tax=Timema shepardi TaxID=629360 RepID=A0A7R9G6E1_TIMSH|nr:unnamed protein product [Timema shepardi]